MNEQYNYDVEKFLDSLYKNLYLSEKLQNTKDSTYESVKKYMDKLENAYKNADTSSKIYYLKNLYYTKYVINKKDISDNLSNEEKESIIYSQKKTLNKWIDYLSDKNSMYPMWAKYWVFQGMLEIGDYDEVNGFCKTRNKKTTAPFISVDSEIISKCISTLQSNLIKENIDDENLEKIINSCNFSKIYSSQMMAKKKYICDNLKNTDGVWAEFYQNNVNDSKILADSLQNKYTGWSTADESIAKAMINGGKINGNNYNGGDFYVYYTKDNEGNYTIPRISIRMDGKDKIAEVRGVDDYQNIEKSMIQVLKDKIMDMPFLSLEDVQKYTEKINDLDELNTILNKTIDKEKLSDKELHDLYIKKFGFGVQNDSVAIKLIQKRCFDDYNLFDSIDDKKNIVYNYRCVNDILPLSFKVKDKEVIDMVINNTHDLSIVDNSFKVDKDFILKNAKKCYSIINWMDDSLKNDRDFLIKLFITNYNLLFLFDSPLKKDKIFAFELVSSKPESLQYLDSFRSNKDFLLQVFKNNSNVLKYADEKLKKDKNFILKLVRINKTKGLDFADKSLKYDDNFVLSLVNIDKNLFDYADNYLKKEKNFIINAINQNYKVFSVLDSKSKHDPMIICNYFISAIKEKTSNIFFIDKIKLNLRVLGDIFNKKLKLYNGSFSKVESEQNLNNKRI